MMALVLCAQYESNFGVTITVPFAHYMLVAFSLFRVINTDVEMAIWEIVMLIFAFALQYAWGFIYLFNNYESAEKAGHYIATYLIVIPFISATLSAFMKFRDDSFKLRPVSIALFILSFLQGISLFICAYLYLTLWTGIGLTLFITLLIYAIVQTHAFVKNNYNLPQKWATANYILLLLIVIGAIASSIAISDFNDYLGFSISVWVISSLAIGYGGVLLFLDINGLEDRPVFFSPWIFPVYKFDPKKENIERRNSPSISLLTGCLVLIIWGILSSNWLEPLYLGVSLCILLVLLMVTLALYLISISTIQLSVVRPFINKQLLKKAWLATKSAYIEEKGAASRDDLVTYAKMRERRDNFRVYIKRAVERGDLVAGKQGNLNLDPDIDVEWIDEELVELTSLNSCQSFLHWVDKKMTLQYLDEVELLILFELNIVHLASALQSQERKTLFRFLREKAHVLEAAQIAVSMPGRGSNPVKYAQVLKQINALPEEKKRMFENIKSRFDTEMKERERLLKIREAEEERAEKEKQERAAALN